MRNDDVALVHRALADDESAFAMLVEKHQKQVHALAWRIIGDFHIAQDITQETFLKAHQKLVTLKDPHRFSGWLNAITTRCCLEWFREKRLNVQLSENVDIATRHNDSYSQYLVGEQAKAATQELREIVKKWIAKLQESERTVITLHYFDGMSCEEIAVFLGVSTNTIKSQLSRARQRLKKQELLVRSGLDDFQIFATLNEATKTERHIRINVSVTKENGEEIGKGTGGLKRTDAQLGLTDYNFGWAGNNPFEYLVTTFLGTSMTPFLLKYPTVVGKTWIQEGLWHSQAETTLDGHEHIQASAELFPMCLKHKSVLSDAAPDSQKNGHTHMTVDGKRYALDFKRDNPVNGTRYLWFANGIGLVKMRYEHDNGLTTEAELFEYKVPGKIEESLPLQIGSTYTYKYHHVYLGERVIEKWRVTENF